MMNSDLSSSPRPTRRGVSRLVWCQATRAKSGRLPMPMLHEIHVWSFCVANESVQRCLALLSLHERVRVSRFHTQHVRDQSVVARAKLRWLVGGYLGIEPAQLQFAVGSHGKLLLPDDREAGLHFNLSHSQDTVALSFTSGRAVGIDVEHVRPVDDLDGLMRIALTPAEQDDVRSQPPGLRLSRFFQFWTRKEAYLKATGEGITAGVAHVDALALDGRFSKAAGCRDAASWSLHDIELGHGIVGAVVAQESPMCNQRVWGE